MCLEERVREANEETLVCLQIEHVDGIRNIDDILSVPGVDAAFIGPYDLSASMGITGQFDDPKIKEAERTVLESCRKHGVAPGIHVVQPHPDEAIARIKEGYLMIAYSLDITMLNSACKEGLAQIRSQVA
jgi:2-dehydro-3-deoxyglucarate aldolase